MMIQTSGYNMKMTRFILNDSLAAVTAGDRIRKMQICRVGTFTDPRYGTFQITKLMLDEMVANFKRGVRGVIPALDYKHESDDVAAGWFKDLYVEGDELWANIEMTPKGEKVLADKEFGYVSADFDTGYTDNETNEKFGCVLLGAGLTNRPVIKRMESVIQLSEKEAPTKGEPMNEEEKKKLADMEAKLASYKKLEEDMKCADPEALMQMIMELKKKVEDMEGKKPEMEVELMSAKKELAEVKEKLTLTEKTGEFTKLLSEGKACEAQREAFLKGDMAEFVAKAQAIKLAEQGHATTTEAAPATASDAEDKVLEEAKKLSEEKKMSMKDAISEVLKNNKQLADKIRN